MKKIETPLPKMRIVVTSPLDLKFNIMLWSLIELTPLVLEKV